MIIGNSIGCNRQPPTSPSSLHNSNEPLWFYRRDGLDCGPVPANAMASWLGVGLLAVWTGCMTAKGISRLQGGWFKDDLQVRTTLDERYYTIAEYKTACGGRYPFSQSQANLLSCNKRVCTIAAVYNHTSLKSLQSRASDSPPSATPPSSPSDRA